jgi:hypothetical protein
LLILEWGGGMGTLSRFMANGSPTPTPSGCSARLRGGAGAGDLLRAPDLGAAGLRRARLRRSAADVAPREEDAVTRGVAAAFVARFAERPAARPRAFWVRLRMIASG